MKLTSFFSVSCLSLLLLLLIFFFVKWQDQQLLMPMGRGSKKPYLRVRFAMLSLAASAAVSLLDIFMRFEGDS